MKPLQEGLTPLPEGKLIRVKSLNGMYNLAPADEVALTVYPVKAGKANVELVFVFKRKEAGAVFHSLRDGTSSYADWKPYLSQRCRELGYERYF